MALQNLVLSKKIVVVDDGGHKSYMSLNETKTQLGACRGEKAIVVEGEQQWTIMDSQDNDK